MSIEVTRAGETWMVEEESHDDGWFWPEFASGRWEPETFDFLDRYLDADADYVDIGAWIGPTVLYAARRARHVYCAEPDPEAATLLRQNITLNGLDNVTVFEGAICDRDGPVRLGRFGEWGDSQSSLTRFSGSTVEVEGHTPQTFYRRYNITDAIAVKIDTEGGEGLILPAADDLWLGVPMFLGVHGPWMTPNQREAIGARDEFYNEIRL